jgi:hypothetical protein
LQVVKGILPSHKAAGWRASKHMTSCRGSAYLMPGLMPGGCACALRLSGSSA